MEQKNIIFLKVKVLTNWQTLIKKGSMNKITLIFGSIFTLAVSVLFFINLSNDHKECGKIVKNHIDASGNKVEVVEHICKENYSF